MSGVVSTGYDHFFTMGSHQACELGDDGQIAELYHRLSIKADRGV